MTKIRNEQFVNPLPKDLSLTSQIKGSVLYFDGTNWVVLNPSTDGYVLTTHAAGNNPSWTAVSGGGSGGVSLTSTPPNNTDKSAAQVGTSIFAARGDHKHDLNTGVAVSVGTVNAEGTATTLARSDHTHIVSGLNIASQVQGDILYFDGTNWVRLPASTDGNVLTTHSIGQNPTWTVPSGGVALTSSAPVTSDKSASQVGVSTFAARGDHKHDISTAAAVSVGTVNAEGAATTLARSDHTHIVSGLNIPSQTQGDILYFNGTSWVRLPAGSDGYALITHGAGQNPTWDANFKAQTINLNGALQFNNAGNLLIATDSTSISSKGKALNVTGQNMSAFNSVGGNVVIQSGIGSFADGINASDGYIQIKRGNNVVINFTDGYSDYIQLGAMPGVAGAVGRPTSTTGHIRMPNATSMRFRNSLNTVDIIGLQVTSLNTVVVGGTAGINISIGPEASSYQSMTGGVFINEASLAPIGNPTTGSFLYVNPVNHHPTVRTQDGYITDLAVGTGIATTLNITGQTKGDVLFFDGVVWNRLQANSDGYILTTHNVSQNPTWTSPYPNIISVPSGGRTLQLSDQNNIIRFSDGYAISVTIPTNASVPFQLGASILLRQAGAGQFTLVPAGGVILNTSTSLISARQHATVSITKVNTNEWDVTGERQ